MTARIPLDYFATQKDSNWQNGFQWPIKFDVVKKAVKNLLPRFIKLWEEMEGDERDLYLMCGPHILSPIGYVVEIVLALEAAEKKGLGVTWTSPWIEAIATGKIGKIESTKAQGNMTDVPNFTWLRHLVRVVSWSKWWQIPKAWLVPEAIAISHNSMLQGYVGNRAIGFKHATVFLAKARKLGEAKPVDKARLREIIETVLADTINSRLHENTVNLLTFFLAKQVAQAMLDLDGMRKIKKIPLNVWAGTADQWATRALSIEIMRRGGKITRFDHSGGCCVTDYPHSFYLAEYALSHSFVVTTTALAECIQQPKNCKIIGGSGDIHFKKIHVSKIIKTTKKRVLYLPTIFKGDSQYHFPLLSDPVYLDWQLRLTKSLLGHSFELLCKPHPEGLLMGQKHPLADIAQTSQKPSEEEMDEADIFLFDYAATTPFWKALMTDKPVILLDFMNYVHFTKKIETLLEKRITRIFIDFNQHNIPVIPDDLNSVVKNALQKTYDPTPLRKLYT